MRNITTVACLIIGHLFANAAAQTSPQTPLALSYQGGQLKISAHESTLADVLRQVATLTGAKIDIPREAENEKITTFEVGPTSARQMMVLLLSDSNFDYLIQGSDSDPNAVKSVLLFSREKKSVGLPRVPQAVAISDRPTLEPPVVSADPVQLIEATPPAVVIPPAPADFSNDSQRTQSQQSNVPKTMPVPLPAVMSQQSIAQQLQQMYQQRVQMQPTTPGSTGSTVIKQ